MKKINPNWLTASRMIVFGPLCLLLLCINTQKSLIYCFGAMFLAVATDFADGKVARATGQVTNFGKIFDPLCDSAYLAMIWLGFLKLEWILIWIVPIFLVRDQIVAYIRIYLSRQQVIMSARWSGKVKLAVQVFVQMTVVLLHIILPESEMLNKIQFSLIFVAAAITTYSLYDYFKGFCQKVEISSFFKLTA